MNILRLAILPLLVACSAEASLSDSAKGSVNSADDLEAFNGPLRGLRLDLVPTELPARADAITVLPQSFDLPAIAVGFPFDAGLFTLEDPVELLGTVTAPDHALLVPIAQLPGEGGTSAVDALVRLDLPGTLQSYRASTDIDGNLQMFVMPSSGYRGAIVPADPFLPITPFEWEPGQPLDLTLEYGAPIFGRAQIEANDGSRVPLEGVGIYAVTPDGVRSTVAQTDASGFFHLSVDPGTYTVVCEGRPFGQDPVLTYTEVVVDDDGADKDFLYQAIDSAVVDGRILAESGDPVQGMTVRLTAITLDGLETLQASFVSEKVTDADGGFLVRVPPGVYDVELLPASVAQGDDYTPLILRSVALSGDVDLGRLDVLDTRPVTGTIADNGQARVSGAVVACRERDFGHRAWSAVSDEEGRFMMNLPQVPLDCAITPPATRTDLALTRRTFDPAGAQSPTLSLTAGQTVSGQVARDGAPEAYVVVEVRDDLGALLGSALTDEQGAWSLQVDPAASTTR